MVKRTTIALSIAILALAAWPLAQESATLVLRSGERISGQLTDMGGAGFTVRVNGNDRNVPTGDVAVIEFSGGPISDAEWQKIGTRQQVVVLRNGDIVEGTLTDIGGTSPLRVTVRTANGDRDFSSNEVGRVVLARPATAVATSGSAPPAQSSGPGLVVSGRQQWTPTGISVRRGETVRFNASGEVQLGADAADVATPGGSKAGRTIANGPLQNAVAGALVGRVNNGAPFLIGGQTTVVMPAAGQLFLGINDDHVADNQGEFRVEIVRGGR